MKNNKYQFIKTNLLFLLLLVSLSSYAQFTTIPDVNFEKALIAHGIDTDGLNGKVLTSSINTVTYLDVSTADPLVPNITDLTGIQDFTSLTFLSCYLNSLTSLDLSKNTKLGTIDCRANSLTSLDLSNLPLLVGILCSENYLASLDVSKNPILTGVFCSNNNLLSLNVKNGNNTKFQSVFCDFRFNPRLTCIQVDNVTYSNTNWNFFKDNTSVYSNSCGPRYTTIPDLNFENKLISLGIDNDGINGKILTSDIIGITTLDLSNSLISNLSGIEDFVSLVSLNVSKNQLTVLNINLQRNIRALDCSNNLLKNLDLSKNLLLTTLDLSNNQVSNLNLFENISLVTLKCSSNQLNTMNFSRFSLLKTAEINNNLFVKFDISSNKFLSILKCNDNKLTSLDVSQNNTLVSLFCANNQIVILDVSANLFLNEISCQNNKLISLNLKNGKNNLFTTYDFRNNIDLKCIQVDDEMFSTINWINNKDAISNFSLYCGNFTSIPDEKFEDKLIALGIDTDGKNGNTLTSSIASVTYLDLSGDSIYNLKGIQDFVSLKTLLCPRTYLTTLDFSKNVALISLDCSSTQLKSLNISKNIALTSLNCSKNYLTSLDVSTNINLTSLSCFSNTLTSLNVSTNTILTTLSCYSNKLTSLDVTKNTLLTNLACNNNQLTVIDVSGNKSLISFNCSNNLLSNLTIPENASLTLLFCSSNKLTSLDISKSVALLNLDCEYNLLTNLDVSQNISIARLHCNNNMIIALDVSRNLSLGYFYCNLNKLKSLDLSKNLKLQVLTCAFNNLSSLDLRNGQNIILYPFLNGFRGNPNLTCIQVDDVIYANKNWKDYKDTTSSFSMDCSNINYTLIPDTNFENRLIEIGIDSGILDGKVLTANILTQTTLILGSFIKDLTGIKDFVALKTLTCDYSPLKSIDVSKNVALTSLSCSQNLLTSLDISNNPELTFLNCGTNQIASLNVTKNNKLISLTCGGNPLKSIDVSKNILLNNLNCKSNQLSILDVSKNTLLKILDCSYNQITNLDVSKNTALTSLTCYSNNLFNLNLKNGKNNLFISSESSFFSNPNLFCIQVDNANYSTIYWNTIKPDFAIYSDNCPAPYILISSKFEDKLIALGIDTDGKNGTVLLSSITNVTSIDVSNSGITNLSGIEYFTALETLNCKGNLLTTINLTNNTALKYLDCFNNPLTTLDVSKNILLVELYCDGVVIITNKISNAKTNGAGQLTVLDLSNNMFLTKLSCSNNQLTSLDVSKNTLLTTLNCSNNSLQNLNVNNGNNTNMAAVNFKNNSSLSCIKVDNNVYANANWAEAKDATALYSKTACTLGVNDLFYDKIVMYPNPVRSELQIDNIVLEKATVYDVLGKLIKTTKFTNASDSNTLDLSNLTKGVYLIYLQSEEVNAVRKIIVE
jgi:Leucine-rich repeat (LRR) protein